MNKDGTLTNVSINYYLETQVAIKLQIFVNVCLCRAGLTWQNLDHGTTIFHDNPLCMYFLL